VTGRARLAELVERAQRTIEAGDAEAARVAMREAYAVLTAARAGLAAGGSG
jgi:hypothetical protein